MSKTGERFWVLLFWFIGIGTSAFAGITAESLLFTDPTGGGA